MSTKSLMKVDPVTGLLIETEDLFPFALSPKLMDFPISGKEMHMKVEETKKEYKVTVKTPGYEKKHLKVNVKNGLLTFSGERQEECSTKTGYSSSYGSFTRSIPLPDGVRPKGAKVEVKNGEVKVTMEKKNGK